MGATAAFDHPLSQPSPPRASWLAYGAGGAIVLAALAQVSMAVAALLFVALFLYVALKRLDVALMLTFASAPFQSDLSGGGGLKFSLAEVNLALLFVVLMVKGTLGGRRVTLGPIAIPILLYLAVCTASSLLSWRDTTLVSLFQTGLYLIVATAIFASLPVHVRQFDLCLNGLVCVGVFLAFAAVALRSNYVFGLHKNGIGASLCCAFLVAAELWFAETDRKQRTRYAFALAVIAAGLLMSLSRGAWLATASGLILIVTMRRQFRLLFRAGLLLVPVVVLLWFTLPEQARESATTLSTEQHGSVSTRLRMIEYAWGVFESSPVFGVGVGLRKEYDATNVVLSTLAETGILGLAAFTLVHLVLFAMVWRAQGRLPRASRVYSLLMIGGALVLAKLTHGLLDHYWGRGSATLAWSGAGMSVWAHMMISGRGAATAGATRAQRIGRDHTGSDPVRVDATPVTGTVR